MTFEIATGQIPIAIEMRQTIRPLQPTDMPDVKAVIDSCGLFPSEMLDEMTAGYFSGKALDDFWLTYDDGKPMAIAYCASERMTDRTWNLLLIAVHQDRQRKGHGTEMMHHVEDALVARGERLLLVETSGLPGFEKTRQFYRKIRYNEEARIRDFYQAGEDKVVFRKVLRKADKEAFLVG